MKREWIKVRLGELKKTQTGLAAVLGIAHPRITDMIKSTRRLQLGEVDRFAAYMEMSRDEVLDRFSMKGGSAAGDGSVSIHEQIAKDPYGGDHMSEREKRLSEKLRGLGEPEQKYVEKFIDSLSKDD